MSSLSDVLVLLAPYGTERASTAQFVSRLQEQGANVLRTQAKAEVSLTRNVIAGGAYDVLRQAPELEWVFWLDQDVSGNAGNLVVMKQVAEIFGRMSEPNVYPSITGLYMNRYSNPTRLAAYAVARMGAMKLPAAIHGIADVGDLEVVPVLCGLGCLLQHRSTFMRHCDESQHFGFPNRERLVPEVCSSHLIHSSELAKYIDAVGADEDFYYWQSEDFDYCCREWEHGRSVYSLPIAFGHECDRILYADEHTVFPGLRPPNNGEQASSR